jgi:hypothetical protein
MWTEPPRTWVYNELVDETDLNTHIRDQLIYLKSNPVIAETTVTSGQTGDMTVATLAGIAIPADVGKVYVECWAISFGARSPTANPSSAYVSVGETTAGVIISGEHQDANFGASYSSVAPFYARSRDLAWANSTRTVTLSMSGSNCSAWMQGSAASPIVLRIVRSY